MTVAGVLDLDIGEEDEMDEFSSSDKVLKVDIMREFMYNYVKNIWILRYN